MTTMAASYQPHTRLRLTTRGRRVVAALIALPLLATLGYALLGGATSAGAVGAGDGVDFDTVTVLPGESLWSLAEQVAPGSDPREVVDAIVRLNQLDGGTVDAGAQIAIPTEYTDAR